MLNLNILEYGIPLILRMFVYKTLKNKVDTYAFVC